MGLAITLDSIMTAATDLTGEGQRRVYFIVRFSIFENKVNPVSLALTVPVSKNV